MAVYSSSCYMMADFLIRLTSIAFLYVHVLDHILFFHVLCFFLTVTFRGTADENLLSYRIILVQCVKCNMFVFNIVHSGSKINRDIGYCEEVLYTYCITDRALRE